MPLTSPASISLLVEADAAAKGSHCTADNLALNASCKVPTSHTGSSGSEEMLALCACKRYRREVNNRGVQSTIQPRESARQLKRAQQLHLPAALSALLAMAFLVVRAACHGLASAAAGSSDFPEGVDSALLLGYIVFEPLQPRHRVLRAPPVRTCPRQGSQCAQRCEQGDAKD